MVDTGPCLVSDQLHLLSLRASLVSGRASGRRAGREEEAEGGGVLRETRDRHLQSHSTLQSPAWTAHETLDIWYIIIALQSWTTVHKNYRGTCVLR